MSEWVVLRSESVLSKGLVIFFFFKHVSVPWG